MTVRQFLLAGGLWTAVAAFSVAQMYAARLGGPQAPDLPNLLITQGAPWLVWWLGTPLALAINRRVVERRLPWKRALAAHGVAGAVLALLPALVMVTGWMLARTSESSRGLWWEYRAGLALRYGFDLATYVALASVAALFSVSRRADAERARAATLEAELTSARLTALSRQIQPHFLFNALNSVAMLIREGANDRALRTVLGYADLLRVILHASDDEVTVQEELQFLQRYLDVEELRFPNAVAVEIGATPAASRAMIPRLILQPLVENALRHGVPAGGDAVLRIDARVDDSRLLLTVADNGPGLRPDWREDVSPGVGVRNTRARLRHRYGDDFAFRFASDVGGGTVARLDLPYVTARDRRGSAS